MKATTPAPAPIGPPRPGRKLGRVDIPLPLASSLLAAVLALVGAIARRHLLAIDAVTATQQEIARTQAEDRTEGAARHREVMTTLERIAEALGLEERLKRVEQKLKMGAGEGSPIGSSRGSRPGR